MCVCICIYTYIYIHLYIFIYVCVCVYVCNIAYIKPHTHVARYYLVIDLRLDIKNDCDGFQQKFQHAEYFTCDPLITRPILIQFSNVFHHLSQDFISNDSP